MGKTRRLTQKFFKLSNPFHEYPNSNNFFRTISATSSVGIYKQNFSGNSFNIASSSSKKFNIKRKTKTTKIVTIFRHTIKSRRKSSFYVGQSPKQNKKPVVKNMRS